MKVVTTRFRPQNISKGYLIKDRLGYGTKSKYNYNFQTRVEWFPVGYKLNRRTISKQFGKLHYLACHSPKPIALKWRKAYNVFMNKHFAEKGNASMRFLNKWTAHSWL